MFLVRWLEECSWFASLDNCCWDTVEMVLVAEVLKMTWLCTQITRDAFFPEWWYFKYMDVLIILLNHSTLAWNRSFLFILLFIRHLGSAHGCQASLDSRDTLGCEFCEVRAFLYVVHCCMLWFWKTHDMQSVVNRYLWNAKGWMPQIYSLPFH